MNKSEVDGLLDKCCVCGCSAKFTLCPGIGWQAHCETEGCIGSVGVTRESLVDALADWNAKGRYGPLPNDFIAVFEHDETVFRFRCTSKDIWAKTVRVGDSWQEVDAVSERTAGEYFRDALDVFELRKRS